MTFADQLQALIDDDDDLGLGNLMLDTLTRPHQEHTPDAEARLLQQRIPTVIEERYGVRSYANVYRDRHLSHADRGTWDRDDYVQLLIFAYVLGATRENLPPPHDKLVPYYRRTADEQRRYLAQAAQARNADPKPKVRADDLEREIREMLDLELSPKAIADQLTFLLRGKGGPPPQKKKPLTPEDFS